MRINKRALTAAIYAICLPVMALESTPVGDLDANKLQDQLIIRHEEKDNHCFYEIQFTPSSDKAKQKKYVINCDDINNADKKSIFHIVKAKKRNEIIVYDGRDYKKGIMQKHYVWDNELNDFVEYRRFFVSLPNIGKDINEHEREHRPFIDMKFDKYSNALRLGNQSEVSEETSLPNNNFVQQANDESESNYQKIVQAVNDLNPSTYLETLNREDVFDALHWLTLDNLDAFKKLALYYQHKDYDLVGAIVIRMKELGTYDSDYDWLLGDAYWERWFFQNAKGLYIRYLEKVGDNVDPSIANRIRSRIALASYKNIQRVIVPAADLLNKEGEKTGQQLVKEFDVAVVDISQNKKLCYIYYIIPENVKKEAWISCNAILPLSALPQKLSEYPEINQLLLKNNRKEIKKINEITAMK